MSERHHRHHGGRLEERVGAVWFGLINFGLFLILVGLIVAITPNINQEMINFFNDLKFQQILPAVFFPVPTGNHTVLYKAVFEYCIGWGVIQAFFLVLRFALRDWPERKARAISSTVFWFGLAYILYLVTFNALAGPTAFGYFIIMAGIALIVRVAGYFL